MKTKRSEHSGVRAAATATFILLTACLVLGAVDASAKLVTIEKIPRGIPEDLAWGEIVREIRIEGNRYTREKIIRQAFKSRIGHPYTQENARLDLLWIARLGSFTSVSFATEPVADGIALITTVKETSPYIPSLSMKLTQENGFEIGPSFSSSNLFGTAARASAYARFGGATNIGIRYLDPRLPVRSILWGHNFQYFHRERTNKLLEFQETTDEIFYEFMQPTTDDTRTGLRFRYMALKSDRDGVTLGSDNHDHMPSLGVFFQTDSRNGIYPTNGWFVDLEVSKYGAFGGDGDFWRTDLDIRRYFPLSMFGDRHSMTLNSYAALTAGELDVTIPRHQEFFIGGTNSVRGWSLGSRQGSNQWLNTVEYWFRLMDQKAWKFWFIKWRMGFQLGAFFDVGTAWSDYEDLDRSWISGGGAGFRLTMPVVTMFRFDVAYGESGPSVRMFIGGGEKAIAQKQRVR